MNKFIKDIGYSFVIGLVAFIMGWLLFAVMGSILVLCGIFQWDIVFYGGLGCGVGTGIVNFLTTLLRRLYE